MRPAFLRSWDRTSSCGRTIAACLVINLVCGSAAFGHGEEGYADGWKLATPFEESSEASEPATESDSADSSNDQSETFAEPSKPDEVFTPVRPHIETIDGAPYNGNSQTPPSYEDPLPSGFTLRWFMPVDGFGITDLELSTVDHRPRFSDVSRFNLNLPFAVHFVDEPQALGVPSELYSAQIEARWIEPIGEYYGVDISVIPGWFSDFDAGDNNGFRVTGHAIATVMLSDQFHYAFGAMYLGREDVRLLPAGGIVWFVQPDTKLELLMPKPRVLHRVAVHDKFEHYVYTGFELFGGNSWAVTRPDDSYDTFTYRDFRFVVGHELRGAETLRHFFEIGYVFSRKLEFKRSPETLEPGGTLLLRVGSSY